MLGCAGQERPGGEGQLHRLLQTQVPSLSRRRLVRFASQDVLDLGADAVEVRSVSRLDDQTRLVGVGIGRADQPGTEFRIAAPPHLLGKSDEAVGRVGVESDLRREQQRLPDHSIGGVVVAEMVGDEPEIVEDHRHPPRLSRFAGQHQGLLPDPP